MFWNYLQKLKVEMGDILGCCQFISEFLDPTKLTEDLLRQPWQGFDQRAALHKFCPDLYNFMWK